MNIDITFGAKTIRDIPWDTIITNIVVIIGFVFSVVTTRRNIKAEVEKMKKGVSVEALQSVLFVLCSFLQNMKFANTPEDKEGIGREMITCLQKVIAYGSEDAVRIAAEFQQFNYNLDDEKDRFRALAFYAILAAQLKHDITGELISPETYYKFFLTDYTENADKIKKSINELVKEFKLRNEMIVS